MEIIDRQSIDLVLLDIMMPDFDGIETLQAIRAKYSMAELPVIMATAKDSSEDMLQAFELGANDYVTKPIDLPIVLARIQSHLRLIQLAQQQQPTPSQLLQSIDSIEPIFNDILPIEELTVESTIQSINYASEQSLLEISKPETNLLLGRYKINGQLLRDDVRDIYLAQDTHSENQPTCLLQQIQLDRERPSLRVAAIYQFQREIQLFKKICKHPN